MSDTKTLEISDRAKKVANLLSQGMDVIVIGDVGDGKSYFIEQVKASLVNTFKKEEVYMRELEHQGCSDIIACIPQKKAVFVADYDTIQKAQKFIVGDFQQAKDLARGGQLTSLVGTYPLGFNDKFYTRNECIEYLKDYNNLQELLSTTLPTDYASTFEKGTTAVVYCYSEAEKVVSGSHAEYVTELISYK